MPAGKQHFKLVTGDQSIYKMSHGILSVHLQLGSKGILAAILPYLFFPFPSWQLQTSEEKNENEKKSKKY